MYHSNDDSSLEYCRLSEISLGYTEDDELAAEEELSAFQRENDDDND